MDKVTEGNVGAGLRGLPSVDELLARPTMAALVAAHGRPIMLRAARSVLAEIRRAAHREAVPSDVESLVRYAVAAALRASLRRVINATGVVLHTNLGRAPISAEAAAAIADTATRYSNLEYDLRAGKRGRRDVHTVSVLAELAGRKRRSS